MSVSEGANEKKERKKLELECVRNVYVCCGTLPKYHSLSEEKEEDIIRPTTGASCCFFCWLLR